MRHIHPPAARRPGRPLGSAIALLALLLISTGCLRGTVDVAVEDDGAGTVEVTVFPDSDVMGQVEGLDLASSVGAPPGAVDLQVDRVYVDDRPGYRIEFGFADPDALGAALQAGVTVAGRRITLFESFDLREVDYGIWRLDAAVSPPGEVFAEPTGDGGAAAEVQALLDGVTAGSTQVAIELTISMPGGVSSSNADSSSGGSATWNLDRADGPRQLYMETRPVRFPTPAQAIIGGAALAVVLGIALTTFGGVRDRTGTRRRRRGRAKFVAPSAPQSSWAAPSDTSESVAPPLAPGPPMVDEGTTDDRR